MLKRVSEQRCDCEMRAKGRTKSGCAELGVGLDGKDDSVKVSEDVHVTILPHLCLTWSSKCVCCVEKAPESCFGSR